MYLIKTQTIFQAINIVDSIYAYYFFQSRTLRVLRKFICSRIIQSNS